MRGYNEKVKNNSEQKDAQNTKEMRGYNVKSKINSVKKSRKEKLRVYIITVY